MGWDAALALTPEFEAKTQTVSSLDPAWGETLVGPVCVEPPLFVHVCVYDYDFAKPDDPLGPAQKDGKLHETSKNDTGRLPVEIISAL